MGSRIDTTASKFSSADVIMFNNVVYTYVLYYTFRIYVNIYIVNICLATQSFWSLD